MTSFLGVLLAFDTTTNPEPGVARAPTATEQAAALHRFAGRLGAIALRGGGAQLPNFVTQTVQFGCCAADLTSPEEGKEHNARCDNCAGDSNKCRHAASRPVARPER